MRLVSGARNWFTVYPKADTLLALIPAKTDKLPVSNGVLDYFFAFHKRSIARAQVRVTCIALVFRWGRT